MTARAAAASLMIVGGVVIVALSVGSAAYAIAHPNWIDEQLAGADPSMREQLDAVLSPDLVLKIVIACGLAGAAEGGLSILLGWFVSRGKRWAIATSVAVTFFRLALVALLLVVTVLGDVGMVQAAGPGGAASVTSGDVSTLVSLVVATAVLVATLVLLYRCRRATPPTLPRSR